MKKVELYRQVYLSFRELCAKGEQKCSFSSYCKEHGVVQGHMKYVLADEFTGVTSIPGYKRFGKKTERGILYSKIYEGFRQLCADGKQPGPFSEYHKRFGVTECQIYSYMKDHQLKLSNVPGYTSPRASRYKEVPFEDVIFEEAGFLPAGESNVITVKVDGRVEVSFPADTDIDTIAKFVRKARKEASHVGA